MFARLDPSATSYEPRPPTGQADPFFLLMSQVRRVVRRRPHPLAQLVGQSPAVVLGAPIEWTRDDKADAGVFCLKFQMTTHQHYQYDYGSTGHSFEALARGELNGNGKLSRFRLSGTEAAGNPSLPQH